MRDHALVYYQHPDLSKISRDQSWISSGNINSQNFPISLRHIQWHRELGVSDRFIAELMIQWYADKNSKEQHFTNSREFCGGTQQTPSEVWQITSKRVVGAECLAGKRTPHTLGKGGEHSATMKDTLYHHSSPKSNVFPSRTANITFRHQSRTTPMIPLLPRHYRVAFPVNMSAAHCIK